MTLIESFISVLPFIRRVPKKLTDRERQFQIERKELIKVLEEHKLDDAFKEMEGHLRSSMKRNGSVE